MAAPHKHQLDPTSWLEHEAGWLPAAAAADLHEALVEDLAWEQRAIVLFGREVMQPRLIAWAGAIPYRYSGRTLPPRPAPTCLGAVLARVNERLDAGFNHVLVNRYRDGADSMGLHADDERELGPSPFVASLSLGASRRFVVKPRGEGERHQLELGHGDLLVMGGDLQHHFRHGVPKTKRRVGERICLTFRRVLVAVDAQR